MINRGRHLTSLLLSLAFLSCSNPPSSRYEYTRAPEQEATPLIETHQQESHFRPDTSITDQPQKIAVSDFDYNDNYLAQKSIEDLLAATVQIVGSAGFGSGTLFKDTQTDESYVLTSFHVVAQSQDGLSVKINPHTIDIPEIAKIDVQNDLALLKLSGKYNQRFVGRIAENVEQGHFGVGVGYPFFEAKTLLYGRIATNMQEISEESLSSYQIIEGNINPGDSGGGFFVFREGVPFYGGTLNFKFSGAGETKHTTGLGGIVKVERVRSFLNNTPLADDYL